MSSLVASSTLISHGAPGLYGGTAVRSESAVAGGCSISSRARSGATCRALKRPRPCLTATVVSPSPSRAVASRQEAASPVTISTGQPHVPHSAALMPVSPTSVPLNVTLRQPVPETVWLRTPSAVPAIACMPTSSAASQPCSRSSVYSVHSCWTTKSQRGSSWSGISELNVQASPAPWQSITTTSVAPPAYAPRTAALTSSV